jgi:hypothetical protein
MDAGDGSEKMVCLVEGRWISYRSPAFYLNGVSGVKFDRYLYSRFLKAVQTHYSVYAAQASDSPSNGAPSSAVSSRELER